MRKAMLFTTMILFLSIPISALAVPPPPPPPGVRVTVPLPPPIVFPAPPEVVILPETEVYVAPRVPEEIFFYNGWWWRPWNGRWYRSLHYDSGWGVYGGVPLWYGGIPHNWRENYRNHIWGGHPWNYHYIPHSDLQRNWRTWHNTHYWDKPEHREFTHHHDGRPYAVRARDKGNLDKGYREGHLDKGHDRNQPNKGTTQGNLNKSSTGAGQRNLNKTATTGQGKVGTGGHGATDSKVHSSGHKTQGQHAKGTEGKK